MPSITTLEKPPRRALHIFYVLDTSGSMGGAPIATLNRAMEETVEVLRKQAKSNADAELKIAVLQFNSGAKWVQPNGPEDMEDFIWEDLTAGGLTDVGAALKELDSKLSRNAYLSSMTGAYLPVIIFMSDGYATDDYQKALAQIRQNKWFARGTKIGFALGDDPDMKMISEVVGNCEAVVKTDDLDLFARLIKFASVTSSMLCSTSRTSAEAVTGAGVIGDAIDQGVAPASVVDTNVNYSPEPVIATASSGDGWDDDDWD